MTRPIRVERQRSIRAPQQRVYQLLTRVEGLPRFADIWLVADVLERSGGQVVAEFRGYFGGLPVESVQRLSLRPPGRVEFRQLRGTFKALRGEYVVEPEGSGARLTARVEVEAGIPMLSDQAVQMALSAAVERLLNRVRDAAERDLPRLAPARRSVPARPALAAAGPEAAAAPEEAAAGEASAEQGGTAEAVLTGPAPPPSSSPPPGEIAAVEARRRPGRRRRRRHRRRPLESPPASSQGESGAPPMPGG
ncbi:MAG: SRPBCC family protein [Armatimonadota bacterium]|nr:SRPBCC family protein [Armatimonadota bacterium]